MANGMDEVKVYLDAMTRFRAAEKHAAAVAASIASVSKQFESNRWKEVTPVGESGFAISSDQQNDLKSLDLDRWPNREQVVAALTTYHQARTELLSAYAEVPSEYKAAGYVRCFVDRMQHASHLPEPSSN